MADNYKAIVGKLKLVQIPGAKTLQLAYYNGLQFAVDKSFTEDKLYLIFPPDGQLSKEYAEANDLIRRRDLETGEQKGGFFEANRKVRSIKLMKGAIISVGFIASLNTLAFNEDCDLKLKEGDEISEIGGVPICNKYVNQATLRMKGAANQPKTKKKYASMIGFAEHQDTSQYYKSAENVIAEGDLVTISLKMDGTSVRIGNPYLVKHKTRWNRFIAWAFKTNMHYNKVTVGTRRVTLNDPSVPRELPEWKMFTMARKKRMVEQFKPDIRDTSSFRQIFPLEEEDTKKCTLDFVDERLPGFKEWFNTQNVNHGFYNDGHSMYREPADAIKDLILPGETIYGEIVGWVDEDRPLFKRGNQSFKYGCPPGTRDFYVYAIKHTSITGYTFHLPWHMVKARCMEMGLKTVMELDQFLVKKDITHWQQVIKTCVELHMVGADPFDASHIREGVVVRVDKAGINQTNFLKAKSAEYYALEDSSKMDEAFVDLEDVQS